MSQICYYGDKLSANMAVTPEGFLICKNVPIARTGYQQYLESELIEDGDPTELINVYRSPNEVFSTATLASFEGKPVTNGHPDVDVTPRNYKAFSKGHVQHVRVGRGDDADKILADLYITDQELIDEIRNGKREVSAGYYAEDKEDNSGRICQTKIRGNHVAVVDEGRAGRSVAIRDQKNTDLINGGNSMIKQKDSMNRKQQIAHFVARYLRDASPEELDERVKDAAEVLNEVAETGDIKDACKDEGIKEEIKQDKKDGVDEDLWEAIKSISDRIDAIESRLNDEHQDEEPDEAPLADEDLEAKEEISDEDLDLEEEIADEDSDEDEVVSDEDLEVEEDVDIIPTDEVEEKLSAKDAAIKAISQAALKIKNPEDRKRVQDAIIKATSKGNSQMSGLMKVTKSIQKNKKDSAASKNIDVEKQQAVYDKYNPHK